MDIVLLVQIQDVVIVKGNADRFSCTLVSLVRQRQHPATVLEGGSCRVYQLHRFWDREPHQELYVDEELVVGPPEEEPCSPCPRPAVADAEAFGSSVGTFGLGGAFLLRGGGGGAEDLAEAAKADDAGAALPAP